MALATSIATALSGSRRRLRATWIVLTVLSLTAPALAAERVYIWRDQSGAVRFTPVQEPDRGAAEATSATSAVCEPGVAAAAVATDSTQLGGR